MVDCPDKLKPSSRLPVMQCDRRVQRYQDWQSEGTGDKTKKGIRRVQQSSSGFLKKSANTQLLESWRTNANSTVKLRGVCNRRGAYDLSKGVGSKGDVEDQVDIGDPDIVLVIVCGFLGVTYAAKIKIPSKNRNDDLFSEDEFTFPVEDNKDPTIFKGDVMKAGILMAEVKNQGKGKFKYAVETANGIEIEQIGKLRNDNKTFVVMGSYTYTGANGKRYRVRYTADEFGYHPITELDIDIPDRTSSHQTLHVQTEGYDDHYDHDHRTSGVLVRASHEWLSATHQRLSAAIQPVPAGEGRKRTASEPAPTSVQPPVSGTEYSLMYVCGPQLVTGSVSAR
ncbi:hypothetical protein RP20_CCG015750 [Aedes albopictus]|nr:hypothetical protein RP20_CCG015750 [Aedes albopictus]